jgi:hypothetical protein
MCDNPGKISWTKVLNSNRNLYMRDLIEKEKIPSVVSIE